MVAGQVKAEDNVFKSIQGFPKETAMAMVKLPDAVNGKVIGEGTELSKATQSGDVVKVTIERGQFKFLKFTDTLSLVDSLGEPFAGGVYVKDLSNIMGKSRIIMYDKDDRPLCLAVQETFKINKAYNIYGAKPLKDGDQPQEKEGGVDFYPWFRVRDIDDNHLEFRSLLVWNGNNYAPMLRIHPAKRLPNEPAGDLLPPNKCDNKVTASDNPDVIYALMSKKSDIKERRWDICIAPGADIMAMIMVRVSAASDLKEKRFTVDFANASSPLCLKFTARCHHGRHGMCT